MLEASVAAPGEESSRTILEQRGDVVVEIRISKPSTVLRQRQTWKSALGLGVGSAFMGLGMWFDRVAEDDVTRIAASVAALLSHLIAGRWRVEERGPLPRTDRDKVAHEFLKISEYALHGLVIALVIWIGFAGAGGRFWLAFAILIPSAFAGALLIERGYLVLFDRIAKTLPPKNAGPGDG
ncbi:MAG: hypothetical protein Q8M76_11380 [Spirochaetaceae bacterium]|nr:hypothetical protein [Spirochaetaceae bacterium]